MRFGGLVAVCTDWLQYMTVGGCKYSLDTVHDVWWFGGCM